MAENPTPCRMWTGANNHGYGVRRIDGRDYYVHRLVWEEDSGPLDAGWEVHHLCGEPSCYEREHLVAMTAEEHRALHGAKGGALVNAAKIHCKNNHPLEGDNLWVEKNGARHCKACRADAARRLRARRREVVAA